MRASERSANHRQRFADRRSGASALIALGAGLYCARAPDRELSLEAIAPSKVSGRFDEDISTVMLAARFDLDGRRIASARVACGGMAATPTRAAKAERALVGASLDEPATWQFARKAVDEDFAPLTDMRATAAYRKTVAANLLEKALMEISGGGAPSRIGALDAVE